MMKEYQVTMMCVTGQYKPISTIVKVEQQDDVNLLLDQEQKKNIVNKGVVAICHKKYWTTREVKKYGYIKVKCREYVRQPCPKAT